MVKVFGPGVERSGLKANEPTHFTVDCSGAGDGKEQTRPAFAKYTSFTDINDLCYFIPSSGCFR